MKLCCFVNGIYSTQIGGGDIYFKNLMKDCPLNLEVFGGYYTERFLLDYTTIQHSIRLTDFSMTVPVDTKLWGKLKLLFGHTKRMFKTLPLLKYVHNQDIAYAMSDYWFDTIPLLLCKAQRKILYLGMMAPKVTSAATLYHKLSQEFSLRMFRGKGIVTYSHPDMEKYLLDFGYKQKDIHYIPNGLDFETCNSVPEQERVYDVVWCGRIHPQKGIKDLIYIMESLWVKNNRIKICLIGKASLDLKEIIYCKVPIYAYGVVSEEEKFRLLKSSKVFIFPSHNESFGIAPGEALIAGCHVICYDLPCYSSVYGDNFDYIECFNYKKFVDYVTACLEEEQPKYSNLENLSWSNIRKKFHALLS